MKKIVVVNAGPRKGHNTDLLLKAAAEGAKSKGAEVEYINLYDLPDFMGCRSCFACKLDKTYGKCIVGDGLAPVLESIRTADALIMGSPNYLGNLSAGFRALYERLVFQSLTYNAEEPCCNKHKIPALLIMTTNCPEEAYDKVGYTKLMADYKAMMSNFVGPTETLVCGDTLQVEDYSKYKWTRFDPAAKLKRHNETFADYEKSAFEMGANLI